MPKSKNTDQVILTDPAMVVAFNKLVKLYKRFAKLDQEGKEWDPVKCCHKIELCEGEVPFLNATMEMVKRTLL